MVHWQRFFLPSRKAAQISFPDYKNSNQSCMAERRAIIIEWPCLIPIESQRVGRILLDGKLYESRYAYTIT